MLIDFRVIKEKLEELRQADKNCTIFGSSKHNYKTHPVSALDVESFESKYGFQIPEQYRSFLLEIGYGAGPYYGIWSLEETESELAGMIKDFRDEENVIVNPANVFPFKRNDIELLKINFDKNLPYEDKKNTYPIEGNITILHQGCQSYGTLVTNGEFVGTVWDLYCDGGYDGFWTPARPATCLQASNKRYEIGEYFFKSFPERDTENISHEPIAFLDWYESWLDDSLLAFKELRKFNSFRVFNRLYPL